MKFFLKILYQILEIKLNFEIFNELINLFITNNIY